MSKNFDDRLNAIVVQKTANDAALAAARTEAKNRAEVDVQKRALAKQRWAKETFPLLQAVVQKINQGMAAAAMELKIGDAEKSVAPAIARISFNLFSDGIDTKKSLMLNVNAFGKMVFMPLIPYSGLSRDAHIDTVREEEVTDVILDFLELAAVKSNK